MQENIRQEFFPIHGFSEKPSFAKCRKVISDFQEQKFEPIYVADLILFYTLNMGAISEICGNNITRLWRTISTDVIIY